MKLSKAINFLSCGLLFSSKNADSNTRGVGSLTSGAQNTPPLFTKAQLKEKDNKHLARLFINSGELTPKNLNQFASALAKNIKANVTEHNTVLQQMTELVANFKTAYEAQTHNKTTSFKLEQTSSVASLLENVAEIAHETKPLQKLTGYIDRNCNGADVIKKMAIFGYVPGAIIGSISGSIIGGPLVGVVGAAAVGALGAMAGALAAIGLMGVSNLTRIAVRDKATENTQEKTKQAFKTNFAETFRGLESEALAEKHQLERQRERVLPAQHNAPAPEMMPV